MSGNTFKGISILGGNLKIDWDKLTYPGYIFLYFLTSHAYYELNKSYICQIGNMIHYAIL